MEILLNIKNFLLSLMSYFSWIETLTKEFGTFTKANPVIGGLVGVWFMGILTFGFRLVPSKIYGFLKKQFLITIRIRHNDICFHHLIQYLNNHPMSQRTRSLKINSGRWGNSVDKVAITAGLGNHFFIHNKRIFKLIRTEESTTYDVKEYIDIVTYGRSQTPIRNFLNDIIPEPETDSNTRLFVINPENGEWRHVNTQEGRGLDSVILKKDQKEKLITKIQRFEAKKAWRSKHGIPDRFGIAVYGPPGTGKTSLARALCTYFKRDLYILNIDKMSNVSLEEALRNVSNEAIILVEDFDSLNAARSRNLKEDYMTIHELDVDTPKKRSKVNNNHVGGMSFVTQKGLLNAIDGVTASKGRIIFFSTNDIDVIDPALRRKGRIDVELKLDYLDDETYRLMFNKFYPDFVVPKNVKWKKNITPVSLQSVIDDNDDDPEKVLCMASDETVELETIKLYKPTYSSENSDTFKDKVYKK